MTVINFRVHDYQLYLSRKMTVGDVQAKCWAYIICQGRQGHKFTLHFLRADSDEVLNDYNPVTKEGRSFLPADQYLWYVDLLRHEKPVFCYLNQTTPEWNRLYTGNEPVGEGEDKSIDPPEPGTLAKANVSRPPSSAVRPKAKR